MSLLPSSPPLVPSSPPLLPQLEDDLPLDEDTAAADELPLPIRPSSSNKDAARKLHLKRQFSDYGSQISSDPLFSEGPSDVEEEGSDRRRRKKHFVGPWYNLRRTSTQSLLKSMARREQLRNADSGVFMGSDETESTFDDLPSSPRNEIGEFVERDPFPTQIRPRALPTPSSEHRAARVIQECLDVGRETIDLHGLGLAEITNQALRPLHQLIKHSHVDLTRPPSEDTFRPLTPSIQLFLSGNKLTSLPSELFRLINITVLSLRNNHFSEIPASIAKLPHLVEMNIAQNNVRWLPWVFLDLMHSRGGTPRRNITLRPNPLIMPLSNFTGPSPLPRPSFTPGEFKEHLSRWGETNGAFFQQMKQWYREDDVPWTMRHELELRLKLSRLRLNRWLTEASRAGVELQQRDEQLLYVASSAVRFFDVDGSLHRTANHAQVETHDADELFAATVDPLENAPPKPSSALPSLYELALRSLQSTFTTQDFTNLYAQLPANMTSTLRKAFEATPSSGGGGNEACAVCGSRYIVPRAEWIEYWFHGYPAQEYLTPETVLPFLRRVCSWRCAVPSELGAFKN
ncbi:hypothetical protein BDY17DRAFT_309096 [Neohortaea acidophila]|uniref:Leucine rich repeat domain protein n=1 Tax=Neohortaea acidophila TaxID=245834 RepID=A0A6A6Q2Y9_9PEZI|nr:uncharacterized protein BDY17DRAFT_309096 [Neohortaea acidophila]KAF2485797.1 hypothetical protein BDY17DRAFT_309096 [Neohortaea acidophila]